MVTKLSPQSVLRAPTGRRAPCVREGLGAEQGSGPHLVKEPLSGTCCSTANLPWGWGAAYPHHRWPWTAAVGLSGIGGCRDTGLLTPEKDQQRHRRKTAYLITEGRVPGDPDGLWDLTPLTPACFPSPLGRAFTNPTDPSFPSIPQHVRWRFHLTG